MKTRLLKKQEKRIGLFWYDYFLIFFSSSSFFLDLRGPIR